jgi:hypothetical protein
MWKYIVSVVFTSLVHLEFLKKAVLPKTHFADLGYVEFF